MTRPGPADLTGPAATGRWSRRSRGPGAPRRAPRGRGPPPHGSAAELRPGRHPPRRRRPPPAARTTPSVERRHHLPVPQRPPRVLRRCRITNPARIDPRFTRRAVSAAPGLCLIDVSSAGSNTQERCGRLSSVVLAAVAPGGRCSYWTVSVSRSDKPRTTAPSEVRPPGNRAAHVAIFTNLVLAHRLQQRPDHGHQRELLGPSGGDPRRRERAGGRAGGAVSRTDRPRNGGLTACRRIPVSTLGKGVRSRTPPKAGGR